MKEQRDKYKDSTVLVRCSSYEYEVPYIVFALGLPYSYRIRFASGQITTCDETSMVAV